MEKLKQERPSQAVEKLRVQQPSTLRSILTSSPAGYARHLRELELVEKLPLKLYEELAACLGGDGSRASSLPSLELLNLSGSCCGDAALVALLPGVTHHPKLSLLGASNCCLSDTAGVQLSSILRAQAAAAAQAAWARTLRTHSSSSAGRNKPRIRAGSCMGLKASGSGWSGEQEAFPAGQLAGECAGPAHGLQAVDLSGNQLTSVTLTAMASALADEHCCLLQLNLSFNPQLPPAQAAAAVLQAALQSDPPSHRITVELLQAASPAAAAVATLAASRSRSNSGSSSSAGGLSRPHSALYAAASGRTTSTAGRATQAAKGSRSAKLAMGTEAAVSSTSSSGAMLTPLSRAAVPSSRGASRPASSTAGSKAGRAHLANSSSSGGGRSSSSAGKKGAALVSAPTDTALQLWAGVFVWEGAASSALNPAGGTTGQQQQQEISKQQQISQGPTKSKQQQSPRGHSLAGSVMQGLPVVQLAGPQQHSSSSTGLRRQQPSTAPRTTAAVATAAANAAGAAALKAEASQEFCRASGHYDGVLLAAEGGLCCEQPASSLRKAEMAHTQEGSWLQQQEQEELDELEQPLCSQPSWDGQQTQQQQQLYQHQKQYAADDELLNQQIQHYLQWRKQQQQQPRPRPVPESRIGCHAAPLQVQLSPQRGAIRSSPVGHLEVDAESKQTDSTSAAAAAAAAAATSDSSVVVTLKAWQEGLPPGKELGCTDQQHKQPLRQQQQKQCSVTGSHTGKQAHTGKSPTRRLHAAGQHASPKASPQRKHTPKQQNQQQQPKGARPCHQPGTQQQQQQPASTGVFPAPSDLPCTEYDAPADDTREQESGEALPIQLLQLAQVCALACKLMPAAFIMRNVQLHARHAAAVCFAWVTWCLGGPPLEQVSDP